MTRLSPQPRLTLLALSLLVGPMVHAAAPIRVLYFTKSSGYEHSVVKRADGQPSYSERVLSGIADANGLAFTFSKDGSLFSRDYLAQFDAIMFYTSGNLLTAGTDQNPPLTPDGKQALLDAINGGKGFLAIHAGSDTFHTFETGGGNPAQADRKHRYELNGDASDPYVLMLGGEFINHGKQQVARATVIDPHFPGCGELGDAIECMEEWYSLKEFAPNLHVLLVLQTAGMPDTEYQRPPFPLSWARTYGKGRVWFNAMGHREDVWDSAKFQAMLVGGIKWASGRVNADVTPNLTTAAPGAATLPPPR